jgi:predicted phosphodiesterase
MSQSKASLPAARRAANFPQMQIAIIADPHVSLVDQPHKNIRLIDTLPMVRAIMADVAQRHPDLTLWLGDLTHDGTAEVRGQFRELARQFRVPNLWMWGNHDVEHVTKARFADEVMPCVMRMVLRAAGWDVVIVDTVPELTPANPMGVWSNADLQLLREAARNAAGPLLVLAHHPPRSKYMDMDAFWSAVSGFGGTGVFIGGHSHRDLYSMERGWHLVDVSSCCRMPQGYHWLTLSPYELTVRKFAVAVPVTGPEPTEWSADDPVFPLTIRVGAAW